MAEKMVPDQKVIVVDFGAQYGQLIARRVRDLNVYSELIPYDMPIEEIKALGPSAIILSGGPASVYAEDAPALLAGAATFEAVYGSKAVLSKMDGCTNATHFGGRLGIPAFVFGAGDETLCHSTQDKVPIDELIKSISFYAMFPFFF